MDGETNEQQITPSTSRYELGDLPVEEGPEAPALNSFEILRQADLPSGAVNTHLGPEQHLYVAMSQLNEIGDLLDHNLDRGIDSLLKEADRNFVSAIKLADKDLSKRPQDLFQNRLKLDEKNGTWAVSMSNDGTPGNNLNLEKLSLQIQASIGDPGQQEELSRIMAEAQKQLRLHADNSVVSRVQYAEFLSLNGKPVQASNILGEALNLSPDIKFLPEVQAINKTIVDQITPKLKVADKEDGKLGLTATDNPITHLDAALAAVKELRGLPEDSKDPKEQEKRAQLLKTIDSEFTTSIEQSKKVQEEYLKLEREKNATRSIPEIRSIIVQQNELRKFDTDNCFPEDKYEEQTGKKRLPFADEMGYARTVWSSLLLDQKRYDDAFQTLNDLVAETPFAVAYATKPATELDDNGKVKQDAAGNTIYKKDKAGNIIEENVFGAMLDRAYRGEDKNSTAMTEIKAARIAYSEQAESGQTHAQAGDDDDAKLYFKGARSSAQTILDNIGNIDQAAMKKRAEILSNTIDKISASVSAADGRFDGIKAADIMDGFRSMRRDAENYTTTEEQSRLSIAQLSAAVGDSEKVQAQIAELRKNDHFMSEAKNVEMLDALHEETRTKTTGEKFYDFFKRWGKTMAITAIAVVAGAAMWWTGPGAIATTIVCASAFGLGAGASYTIDRSFGNETSFSSACIDGACAVPIPLFKGIQGATMARTAFFVDKFGRFAKPAQYITAGSLAVGIPSATIIRPLDTYQKYERGYFNEGINDYEVGLPGAAQYYARNVFSDTLRGASLSLCGYNLKLGMLSSLGTNALSETMAPGGLDYRNTELGVRHVGNIGMGVLQDAGAAWTGSLIGRFPAQIGDPLKAGLYVNYPRTVSRPFALSKLELEAITD